MHIFHDPTGKRWRWISALSFILAIVGVLLAISFTSSISANSPKHLVNLHKGRSTLESVVLPEDDNTSRTLKLMRAGHPQSANTTPARTPSTELTTIGSGSSPLAIGFYVNWDATSFSSLSKNVQNLNWLIPDWIHLEDSADGLKIEVQDKVLELVKAKNPDIKILPLINNAEDAAWNQVLLTKVLASAESRERLVEDLGAMVAKHGFAGITVDFEGLPKESLPNLQAFMQALHLHFKAHGWLVAQCVPVADDDWKLKDFAAHTDYLILMAYDQTTESGKAGPIAAQDWFEQVVNQQIGELDPSRTILALGTYGYDWKLDQTGQSAGTILSYQDAMLAARDSKATISFGQRMNPHFAYKQDGLLHEVWFLDAVTAYNQIQATKGYHFAGYALWNMGSEDPSLWQFFNRDAIASVPNADLMQKLQDIHFDYDVDYEGVGEILQVIGEPKQGHRVLSSDAEGLIEKSHYTSFPSGYVIQRSGAEDPKALALTFDDGPNPEWTPAILDILKAKKVPATFFVVGQNVNRATDLLKRMVDEGHELANHTYTHPNLSTESSQVVDLELNATERLVESVTGRQMRLWRAPYLGDAEPSSPAEIAPMLEVQRKFNNIAVGLQVDPLDWDVENIDPKERVTAQKIVDRSMASILNTDPEKRGQIILLHDSGGDRSATIEALPRLIDAAQAKGFHFVSVGTMAGLSRDASMPVATVNEEWANRSNAVVFSLAEFLRQTVYWLFTAGMVLGILRLLAITVIAIYQRYRKRHDAFSPDYLPVVSVVVPAYKEETLITRTVSALLNNDYIGELEIIVVDDGSPDNTFAVVQEDFKNESNVRVFQKSNGGKASALNFGIEKAKGEIIIAIDADTIFPADAIRLMVRHFERPEVGAVAGNAKVGNRINLVTRWQALEYITSQNLDRRVFDLFNCITVVPGAIGAWRKSSVLAAGGFSSVTLAEDQDLTITIRKTGQAIVYEEQAKCYTEAPDTITSLAKQRYRWGFGTLQCAWKHRAALFNPKQGTLGFIGLPNTWIFQILFSLVSPITDLALIGSIASVVVNRMQHSNESASSSEFGFLIYFLIFLLIDLITSFVAFKLEKEDSRLLVWLLIQRFAYRQVMYYVMIKSVHTAIKGLAPGWGKLERKATVQSPVQTPAAQKLRQPAQQTLSPV